MYKYIILFLFFNIYAQQNLNVEYGVEYLNIYEKDTIGMHQYAKEKILESEYKFKRVLSPDETFYHLRYDKRSSLFEIIEIMDLEDELTFATLIMASRLTQCYKIDNDLYIIKNVMSTNKSYQLVDSKIDWQIKDDFKNILGYKCQLAEAEMVSTTNRKFKVKAWFTTEIPVPEGPSIFKGLPGLILGLEKHGRYIYARDIDFPDQLHIEIPRELTEKVD